MKRRRFVRTAGLSAGTLLLGGSIPQLLSSCDKMGGTMDSNEMGGHPVDVVDGNFTTLLSFPSVAGNTTSLTAQPTTAMVKGNTLSVLGYQAGSLLGPIIKVNRGDNININFQNKLSESTNIHWHGLIIPSNMDGHPENLLNAGSSFNYHFTVNQRAGMSWFHPHPHEATARQVAKGLAGFFIINNAEEEALNLPSGALEIPIVIQDKRITASTISYNPTLMEVMTGYFGETILVNGIVSPYHEVSTITYRLRVLNGSNARVYNLALSNNADMIVIGNDGGLLKNPVTIKTVLLAPGERVDVLISFASLTAGQEIFLLNNTFSNAGSSQGQQLFRILKFKVTQSLTDNFIVPAILSSINSIPSSAASQIRNFDISNPGMGMGNMDDGMNIKRMHKINNKVYDSNRIDENVLAGATEIWAFDNSQGDEPHPMHIHGIHFQILQRTGGRNNLTATEGGWKDTVLVLPNEIVKVIVPFGGNLGKYVLYCHNLEHEDDGMMLQHQLN
jgi:blue copper oxidase